MKLHSLDIPDSQEQLAGWLTGWLLSRKLSAVVAELAAVHANGRNRSVSIDEVVGDDWTPLLEHGLDVLPHHRLVPFLRQPTLLLDLQQRVLAAGGAAWELTETLEDELAEQREAGWLRLRRAIDEDQWQALSSAHQGKPATTTHRRLPQIALGIGAVALLAALMVLFIKGKADDGQWGWTRPNAFAPAASGGQYLQRLADLAGEWDDGRPATRGNLLARLSQFRRGCSELLIAEHESLSQDDYQWLAEEGKGWAAALDEQIAALEAGEDVLDVRDGTDEIASRIVKSLNERAAAANAGEE